MSRTCAVFNLTRWRTAAAALCAALPLAAGAAPFSFTVFDLPGATATRISGINNAGRIVGWGDVGNCCAVGFYKDGAAAAVTYDAPGAAGLTESWAVNNAGTIAGNLYDGANIQGFLKNGSTFTPIDLNPLTGIFVTAINDVGQIGGTFSPGNGSTTHGFIKTGSSLATLDLGDGSFTQVSGIDNSGRVVGTFLDATGYHGFSKQGAQVTLIDFAGIHQTFVDGTNNHGDLIGDWYDGSNNTTSAFLVHGNQRVEFSVPGATFTRPTGINDQGLIVGTFFDANDVGHGFLATPVPEPSGAALLFAGLGAVAAVTRRRRAAAAAAALALAASAPAFAFNPQPDPPARLGIVSIAPDQTLRVAVRAIQPAGAAPAATCRVALGFADSEARAIGPSVQILLRPGQARVLDLRAAEVGVTVAGQRLAVHPLVRVLPAVQLPAPPACEGVAVTVELFEPNDRSGWMHAEPLLFTPASSGQ